MHTCQIFLCRGRERMKSVRGSSGERKFCTFVLISAAAFFLGKHRSQSDGYPQLLFQNPIRSPPAISISPNADKTFDIPSLISNPIPPRFNSSSSPSLPPSDPPSLPPPPLPDRFGIVDSNGTMRDDFGVGRLDPDLIESSGNENSTEEKGFDEKVSRVEIGRFSPCPESMEEYMPCLDNVEEIRKLRSTERGEKYERHCPAQGRVLNCLVQGPKEYKAPTPWPRNRDEVWSNNVPHQGLVEDEGDQNWISIENDKFKFPAGRTQFIHGADQYLDQISQMVPDIAFGNHTRVVLDVGCGVASFGAFLLLRNAIALSIAPKDVHENQIQFALERGVPAMVAAFATHRLLYPSQAFDLIHCSRCRINLTRDDGILLLEVNRMLRAGGYFAWAAQPIYKHEESLQEAWKEP